MAKYVRTKDKIIKVDETGYIKGIDVCGKKCLFLFNKNYFYGREVINQADTIEELCDEFVIRHLTSKKPYVADEYQKTQILKDRQKAFEEYGVEEVNGAIYTDKGLIYVAKMNDKGELELI